MYFFCWQVVSNRARTPQKDANIVSKAMHVKLGNRCDTIVIGSQTNFRA